MQQSTRIQHNFCWFISRVGVSARPRSRWYSTVAQSNRYLSYVKSYQYLSVFPYKTGVSDNFILTGDYVAALQILNEFVEFVEACVVAGARGNYNAILHRCEVTRVLLLLILQPSPQRLTPSLAQVLEKYAWAEENVNNGLNMSEDELLLLQSLVLACQSHDHQAVLELENELYPYFDTEQKELLHKLIQVVSTQ
ncbi:40-kDa huntingtin-associated protein [Temnothorax nylanderi]|uniref:40-kDa huntingtin-associated protein n=1 Tax=Temnothorax nylanderi TaxID=102681 RepID=UPI003A892E90